MPIPVCLLNVQLKYTQLDPFQNAHEVKRKEYVCGIIVCPCIFGGKWAWRLVDRHSICRVGQCVSFHCRLQVGLQGLSAKDSELGICLCLPVSKILPYACTDAVSSEAGGWFDSPVDIKWL
jgi:hypothetical protein